MITFILKKLSLPQQKNVVASIGNFLASRYDGDTAISLYSFFNSYLEVTQDKISNSIVSVQKVSKTEIKENYSSNLELLKQLNLH